MRRAITPGDVEPAHEERRGQRIAERALRGHDAHAQHARRRPSRAWVDDVAVALSIHLEELLARPARGQSAVAQEEAGELAARDPPRAHVDRPSLAATPEGDGAAPARG